MLYTLSKAQYDLNELQPILAQITEMMRLYYGKTASYSRLNIRNFLHLSAIYLC
ncbi:Uncharacterised protein [Actinobacillus pleuropneumoniae]|nr:Uncharacterised protein [Actinobacillus pleuropneumoniae]